MTTQTPEKRDARRAQRKTGAAYTAALHHVRSLSREELAAYSYELRRLEDCPEGMARCLRCLSFSCTDGKWCRLAGSP